MSLTPGSHAGTRPVYAVLAAIPDDFGELTLSLTYGGTSRIDAWHAFEHAKELSLRGDAAVVLYRDILGDRPRRLDHHCSARKGLLTAALARMKGALKAAAHAVQGVA